jgi:uncharacterized membrane protein
MNPAGVVILTGHHHHKHMDNTMTCTFKTISEHSTEYISEIEYNAFRGLMPKLLAQLFPGMFKKQLQKWLNNFKEFAERVSYLKITINKTSRICTNFTKLP